MALTKSSRKRTLRTVGMRQDSGGASAGHPPNSYLHKVRQRRLRLVHRMNSPLASECYSCLISSLIT